MTTLTSLIDEANASGWAVTLRQHPDLGQHWECSLSRPTEQTANGIIREIRYATAMTPFSALDYALAQPERTAELIPSGLASPGETALDLFALLKGKLNLQPASTIPAITRR